MLFGGYLDDPDQPYFKMMSSPGQQPLLWLNEDGEHFVDESVICNFSYALVMLSTPKMDKLSVEIGQAVADKKPFIFKAYTTEDLAEKTGLPKNQLTETIARYNGFAAKGEDEDFGKNADYLIAVKEGPFYAFKLNIGVFCTMGVLKVNVNNEVADEKCKVIPALYATGNDAVA